MMMLGSTGIRTLLLDDPYIANVTLLMHFNGADESTTLTDEIGHAFTAGGTAQIDTAQFKYGGASLLLQGLIDDICYADNSADWIFGTNDFTTEVWVRFSAISADHAFLSNYNNSATGWILGLTSAGDLVFRHGDTELISRAWSPSTDTWYHVAASRSGTDLRLFVDGAQLGATVTDSTNIASASLQFTVGSVSTIWKLVGWIDDARITKGVARYTGNFTAPTAQFSDS